MFDLKEQIMVKTDKALPVNKNEKYTVVIEDLTFEGLGVGKVDGYPLFIQDSLPGEEVEIKVVNTGKKYGYGKVLKLIKSSTERAEVKDENYTRVGIAPLQHMQYPAQLAFKKQQVENAMQRIAKMPDVEILDTIGMKTPWGYRNKAQVPVRKIGGQLTTGFFRKNSHDLVPVEDFYIQDPEIDKTILAVRDIMRTYGVKPYNEKDNTGNLRNIMVRRGYYTGEIMLVLVTRTAKLFPKSKIIPDIIEAVPEIVSIVQNIHPNQNSAILGDDAIVLYGEDQYRDKLLGHTFEISHRSFYQVNPTQTEKLYKKVLDFADLNGTETVIDAYCGIGTITLALAEKAKEVYGIEIVEPAVVDAKRNAEINGIENVTYEVGAAEDIMLEWSKKDEETVDLLVVDPPRKGLEGQFIDAALEMGPAKMIYVSCNPSTLARDLALLAEGGYKVEKIQPVDLFPQTIHIEAVALLTK